jgi:hypothetical protein
MRYRHALMLLIITAASIFPYMAHAQAATSTLSNQGVFGCSSGEYGLMYGTLRAVGGIYVPVNDAAVTLNTGYLVYKECILDIVAAKEREAATAALAKDMIRWANTGNDGRAYFVRNPNEERLARSLEVEQEYLKQYKLNNLCAPFRQTVLSVHARRYYREISGETTPYTCTVDASSGEIQAFFNDFSQGGFSRFIETAMNPQNYVVGAFLQYDMAAREDSARAVADLERELDRSGGFLGVREAVNYETETGEQRTTYQTVTPGALVAAGITQEVTTGFRQLENASEIGQIVTTVLAGLTNQALTAPRGLVGLMDTGASGLSYLSRLSIETSAGLRNAALGAAGQNVNTIISVEQAYNTAKRGSKSALDSAASQLESAESICWGNIVPAVQAYARQVACGTSTQPIPTTPCTPPPLNISTSTQTVTGLLALQLAGSSSVANGTSYPLPIVPSGAIAQGTAQLRATLSAQYASTTQLGLNIPSEPTGAPGGALALSLNGQPFTGSALSLTLQSGMQLPNGNSTYTLTPAYPFTAAVLSLTVGAHGQFSEAVISSQIAPQLDQVVNDISVSDSALITLNQIARDIASTASLTAQQAALNRLDAMIANRQVHTSYDARDATEQKNALAGSMSLLVQDTVKSWTTGTGWCNYQNPEVIIMWYNRWKTQ